MAMMTTRLAPFLRAHLPEASGELELTQASGGLSNPTFFVRYGAARAVLRKQPEGELAASAHAIDREYRVLTALQGSAAPVPRPILYHADPGLLGTPFYLMEWVPGFVSTDAALPGLAPARRRALYAAMARAMAAVHNVDWRAVGLADYGKPEGYAARQLRRWSRFWREHGLGDNPALDRLIIWLEAHLPEDGPAALNHGDLRIGNMLFSAERDEVAAVLDWELSTLGDPRADAAYCCLSWHLAPDQLGGLRGLNLAALGIPTEDEFLELYYAARGPAAPRLGVADKVLALFRCAAGSESVAARAARRTPRDTAEEQAARRLARFAAEHALALIENGA